ncbi:hypothetical protein EVG20_g4298 [Dentipellis fragilis]|uniref:F-box domain-containing protein n=1 Tax=Dentipellis fragilis TaxID=205917 RepID=A0A4Y9YWK2_9AGAM|nr:hypothetical protein EVG20_g4298 [Dentipellis fragilis]
MDASSASCSSRPPALALALPAELLCSVAFFLDTPHDLLSFALTCHTFNDIAIPRHIDYRVVRCNLRCYDVWSHLTARPDLARGIRSVEVVDDEVKAPLTGPRRVPGAALSSDTCLDLHVADPPLGEVCLQLSKALRHMELLQEFSMATTKASDLALEAPIWSVLCQRSCLRHVKRLYPRCRSVSPPVDCAISFMVPKVPDILDVRQRPSFAAKKRVEIVGARTPKFTCSREISVRHRFFRYPELFAGCSLPHLRTLCLEINRHDAANGTALTRFLFRTPSIERLRLRGIFPDPLPFGSLPALTHLSIEWSQRSPATPALLADPTLRFRRAIHTLGWVRIDIQGLRVLRQLDGNALRALDIVYFESLEMLKDVARMFPKLERLRVPHRDYTYDWHGVTLGPIHTASWGELVRLLPKLQMFRGNAFFLDPGWSRVADNDDRACQLAQLCPHLRIVEHWDLEKNKAIVLERDQRWEDTKWRVTDVPDEWEWSNVT